ncbi:gliomedin-like [Strongylocentrotus purpuratus]|uniref:Olfactomedin-like domain-containing protein n=1 Tax=Strongylocentrotus purpuratus TaxID=7668 RepID=A0A7M7N9A6_STRPU|nr:gliomedin-like [Strongylocentrotus purpuratus]
MATDKQNECSCSFHIRILYFAFSILCFLTISMFVLTFCYVSQLRETRLCLPEASGEPYVRGTATISQSDRSHREFAGTGGHPNANTLNDNFHQIFEDGNDLEAEKGRKHGAETGENGIYSEKTRNLSAIRKEDGDISRRARRNVNGVNGRRLQVLATVPISIPLSSIANVCNWTNGECPTGPKGNPGPVGLTGQIGQRGLPGPRGEPGVRGKRGDRGPKGQAGENGDRGARGEKGDMGLSGPQGPPGIQGTQIDNCSCLVMNISALLQRLNELTANKTSLLNFVQMSIAKTVTCGCPGPPGPVGPQGEVGPKGDRGLVGLTGSTGDKGERGSLIDGEGHILHGPPGPKGDQGISGSRGPKGDPGLDGVDGIMGLPGFKGEAGPRGILGEVGDPGPMGMKGSKGDMGPMGTRGQIGYDGQKGRKGETGIMGHRGVPGSTGPFGPKGIKGDQGKRGEIGYPGLTGSSGPPGVPGTPGRDGMKGQKGERHIYVLPDGNVSPTEYSSLTPSDSNPTTKPANIEPEKMFKIYEPIVKSQCRLTNISSPREIHAMTRSYGAWMKDTSMDSRHPDMIWVTMHHRGAILIEYKNLDEMKRRRLSATFALPFQWDGAGHVVYNGSFYYHHLNKDYIIRYDLTTGSIIERAHVPSLGYASDDLFQLSSGYTNVDFAVDENGLWIIYPVTRPGSVGKLTVSKLDPESLEIITTITTDHNFESTANAFIVCGVLYTTKGPHSRPSRVDFAFDLFREVVLEDISMNIQNRHRKTVMLSYNPRDRLLYGWDKGKLLTYDVAIKEYTDD